MSLKTNKTRNGPIKNKSPKQPKDRDYQNKFRGELELWPISTGFMEPILKNKFIEPIDHLAMKDIIPTT